MRAFLCMAAAIGLAIPAAPALADEVTVKYDDLALSTPAGQRVLEQRINAAARKACQAEVAMTGTRLASTEARRCIDEAKRKATSQVAALIEERRLGG